MGLMNIKDIESIETVSSGRVFEYLSVSVMLGIVLMILAVWSSKKISDRMNSTGAGKSGGKSEAAARASYAELILGSANVLFLCFGMTGIMILVNNNLARAFAIGAAIAVIRFRIKFDGKGLGATLFFGVLVGMACGVGQIETALGITAAYGAIQTIIIFLVTFSPKPKPAPVVDQDIASIAIAPSTN